MNSIELTLAFHRKYIQRYEMMVPNVYIGCHEWDICGVRKGSLFLDEIEIKVTRSDFLADFNKRGQDRFPLPSSLSPERTYTHWKWFQVPKHELTSNSNRKCNYFWFLMPQDLAEQCMNDIPEYAGLIAGYFDRYDLPRVKEIKSAPRLHKERHAEKGDFLYKLARKGVYRYWDQEHSKYESR